MMLSLSLLVITVQVLTIEGLPIFGIANNGHLAGHLQKRAIAYNLEATAKHMRKRRQVDPIGAGLGSPFPAHPPVMIYVPQWMFMFKNLWENIAPYQPDLEHVEFALENYEPPEADIFGNTVVDHDMFPEPSDGLTDVEGHSHSEHLADAAEAFAEANFNEDLIPEAHDAIENAVTGELPEIPEGFENPFEPPEVAEFDFVGEANHIHEHIENVLDELPSPNEVEPVHGIEHEVSDFLPEQFNADEHRHSIANDNQNTDIEDSYFGDSFIGPVISSDTTEGTEDITETTGSSEHKEHENNFINTELETPETLEPELYEAIASESFTEMGDLTDVILDKDDLSNFFLQMFGVYGDMLVDFRDSAAELQEHSADRNTEPNLDEFDTIIEHGEELFGNNEIEPIEQQHVGIPEHTEIESQQTEIGSNFGENDFPVGDQTSGDHSELAFDEHEAISKTETDSTNQINLDSAVPLSNHVKHIHGRELNRNRENEARFSNENSNEFFNKLEEYGSSNRQSSAEHESWNRNNNNNDGSVGKNGLEPGFGNSRPVFV